MIIFKI
ncbi:hypothetical protein ECFRIK1999_3798, partial [Escherichia coli FRIK1999]